MKSFSFLSLSFFLYSCNGFSFLATHIPSNFRLHCRPFATVKPYEGETRSIVGVVGRGYVPTLTAKLLALTGYQTWMIVPAGEQERIDSLILDDVHLDQIQSNLEFLSSTDQEAVMDKLISTDALIFAVDGDGVIDPAVVDFLLNPTLCKTIKRVVAMSRNLNGKGMGFFVKASKFSANPEVWAAESELIAQYKSFEEQIKLRSKLCGAEYTIVRSGTLKGGACGDIASSTLEEVEDDNNKEPAYYPQYLTSMFYEYTKRDIITWQLLFDCRARGTFLSKGDTLAGPGLKAVFTATAGEACPGDTSRCGVAEAMMRSLFIEEARNIDFAVGSKEGRVPPSDAEWESMFRSLIR